MACLRGRMRPRTHAPSRPAAPLWALLLGLASLAGCGAASAPRAAPAPAPTHLCETGLYAGPTTDALGPGVRTFTPQYPLWTDGAAKQRWIRLPEGAAIDAEDARAWSFPVGTRLWKEFRFGRRVETRFMERLADGAWRYATYIWDAGGADATLAPEAGLRGACETALGTRHDVPSVTDCRACHEAHPSRVLGFSAVQLAPERDSFALHAEPAGADDLGLLELLERGLVRGDRDALLAAAQPLPQSTSDRERTVLGYLHANCGGCHNDRGPLASLGLQLDLASRGAPHARTTALGVASRYRPGGRASALRIAPGHAAESVLFERLSSRSAALQMPPLGTHAVDEDAVALVRAWIDSDLAPDGSVAFELGEKH